VSITKITYVYYHSSVGLTVILILNKINKTQVIVDHLKLQVQSYQLSAQVHFLHLCTWVLHLQVVITQVYSSHYVITYLLQSKPCCSCSVTCFTK